jgi:hypothetical protein
MIHVYLSSSRFGICGEYYNRRVVARHRRGDTSCCADISEHFLRGQARFPAYAYWGFDVC